MGGACRNVRRDNSFDHTGVVMITGIGERMNEYELPDSGRRPRQTVRVLEELAIAATA